MNRSKYSFFNDSPNFPHHKTVSNFWRQNLSKSFSFPKFRKTFLKYMCKRNSDQIQLQKLVKLFKQILTKKKLNLNNSSPPHLPLFFLSKHQFSLFYFTPLFHSVDLTCFFNEKSRHKITAITHNSRKIRINNFTSFG